MKVFLSSADFLFFEAEYLKIKCSILVQTSRKWRCRGTV